MLSSVAGKYAVITGGGSGINLAFANKLLQRGCSVLIGDLSLRSEAKALLEKYPPSTSTSPRALFQRTDVTSWPQLSALMRRAEKEWPQIDIVVPGAGIFEPDWSNFWNPPRSPTNPDTASKDSALGVPGHYATLDINLTHPIRLAQLAVSHWTTRCIPGNLLVVGSMAGYVHGLGSPLYFASKHGVHAFVRSLGALYRTLGIRSMAIAPGAVDTPLWTEDPDKKRTIRAMEKAATPEQIADAMFELLQDPKYGNGTILEATIDGTRVIPAFGASPPNVSGGGVAEYEAAVAASVVERLYKEGLKV